MPASNSPFRDGQRVRVLLTDGDLVSGITEVRCGMRDQGDWFVILEDGRQVCVFHSQMEPVTELQHT